MPYAASAAEAPVSECAGCHMSNIAKTGMTWVQFYPLLRDNENMNAQERPGPGKVALPQAFCRCLRLARTKSY